MNKSNYSLQHELSLVSAPEDFPEHLKSLADLDSNLRCPICKDFYEAPVVIHIPQCCHTFCSVCIRTCFNNNSNLRIGAAGLGGVGNSQRCPICKIQAQEEKIKPVPALEAASVSWQNARPEIIQMINQIKSFQNKSTQLLDNQPIAGPSKETQELSPASLPSNKIDETSQRTTRSGLRLGQQSQSSLTKSPPASQNTRSNKRRSLSIDCDIEILDYDPSDPKAPVECPICGKKMPNAQMDPHLNRCLSGLDQPKSKPKTNSNFFSRSNTHTSSSKNKKQTNMVTTDQKIPLPHFEMLKLKELKNELMKHGLSTQGQTNDLQRRLSKFITIFNSNLDSRLEYRKPIEKIHQDLIEWETLQTLDRSKRLKLQNNNNNNSNNDHTSNFNIQTFDSNQKQIVIKTEREYLNRNQDHFNLLIAQAKVKKDKKPNEESSTEDHQST